MSEQPTQRAAEAAAAASAQTQSLFDRISNWVSEHKAVVYTVAGATLVVTAAGVVYYSSSSSGGPSTPRKSKKERRKAKQEAKDVTDKDAGPASAPRQASVESETPVDTVPEVDEESIAAMSEQERKDIAQKLKAAGNKAYGAKEYNKAIELYGKAIMCRKDPIFYSNRAACYNALSDWDAVIDDCTAALSLDAEYVKALNRRANAYEQSQQYSEALLDYTASAIIDNFMNNQSTQSVERLLKKVAEAKAKVFLETKTKKLPSSMFVSNYLQSFRPKPTPVGLEAEASLAEDSGKGQLRKGLNAMAKRSAEGYEQASSAFDKAVELGDLGDLEAFALNMRGTFRYLKGENSEALEDLTKSVEINPSLTQSYIKRASMHLEQGDRDAAARDFEEALKHDGEDPDIFYHRAQLHFILGEFNDAAKDYQKSIDLDKDFIFSHIQLGVTQYKQGSIPTSMATFRRCRKSFPDTPDVYNYYGELLLDQQKYQEAVEQFDQAVEIEKRTKTTSINVLPLINKALAVFQWRQDFSEAEDLCHKALAIDPECDIAVATMAQLLLQQGKVTEALKYFETAAQLSRTEGEIVNALSYAEATRTQLEVQEKYPQLASRLQAPPGGMGGFGR